MSKKQGVLPPGVKLQPFAKMKTKDHRWIISKSPRCQFIIALFGKKFGRQCEKKSIRDRIRCRSHGGTSGRPVITGEHSKYHPVPKSLQAKFEAALNDPALLDLSKNIALMDAQIWALAEKASKKNDFDPLEFAKLLKLLKSKQALVGQEVARREAIGSMVSQAQMLQLINYVYQSVIKHVKDQNIVRRIGSDLRLLIGTNATIEAEKEKMALIKIKD